MNNISNRNRARIQKTMDGNTAAAYSSYAFTEVAAIFPITPSSPMAESIDEWAAAGKKNLFGQPVMVREMQSEGGAAGTMHGALQGGALTSTYTASQGLLLMVPNMYKIAGELLPGVFHVSARSLASNALSIFGDHQDVMSVRQTGFALLASSNVQDCMDLSAVAHLTAIHSRMPVLHFFDGFRTSHELQKIELLDYEELREMLDTEAVDAFRARALNPDHPVLRGTTQNPDVFFQTREAVNKFYLPLPETFEHYMAEINRRTGRNYQLFNYYGAPDAESILISMGSSCDVIKETLDYANAQGGKYGLVEVHLYRPFSAKHLLAAVPPGVRKITVLDRTKEPGANGEPLYLDVRNAFFESSRRPQIIGGRYGLASKDFTPADVMAVLQNMDSAEPQNGFTVGIVDDVTHLSLPVYTQTVDSAPAGTTACKFWGFGSDGTVSANKSSVKIIGDHTDLYVQAYFAYDSKKSGGLTVSHLRFGPQPIRSAYQIKQADFIACHKQSYVQQYDLLDGIRKGGKFLLNCTWDDEQLECQLPASLKRKLYESGAEFYVINASQIAMNLGLGGRINMITQAAFFKLTGIIPEEEAVRRLKEVVVESYGRQGNEVVEKNYRAIEAGMQAIRRVQVPESWGKAADEAVELPTDIPDFVKNVVLPMNRYDGDSLPVSAFNGYEDGTYPTQLTQYEKRGVALELPRWNPDACIQCNQCALVCPHAVLRPLLLNRQQVEAAAVPLRVKPAKGFPKYLYHLAISPLDCLGCAVCEEACPAPDKAIKMVPLDQADPYAETLWPYLKDIENPPIPEAQQATVKGSQFLPPMMEFSVACAGCAETPYAKLITQLFGDRMMISNSAGCTTVWGGSSPSIPFTKNKRGHGPAWGFSLFEDNAEYGLGMHLGYQTVRRNLAQQAAALLQAEKPLPNPVRQALADWLEHVDLGAGTRERADALCAALKEHLDIPGLAALYNRSDYFIKRSNWVFGGDGWAYDIGYGGLDHVLASGEDVNLMVFDTEVYSNTGGQSSKATPAAAIAKFAAAGKSTKKKDLGMMAISYGNVYVAQIALGASQAQALRAIREAEAYPGPSLLIGYAPCVNHGIRGGMRNAQNQQKRAVEAGYWALYRYNPALKAKGENPFLLDSKEPTADFEEFLMSEVRYSSLKKLYPEKAAALFAKAKQDAEERLDSYRRLAKSF